jgi:hypothetical protein
MSSEIVFTINNQVQIKWRMKDPIRPIILFIKIMIVPTIISKMLIVINL